MHTALAVSLSLCPAVATTWTHQTAWRDSVESLLLLIDLPVTILTLPLYLLYNLLDASGPGRAIAAVLFLMVFVPVGGLQWYLIASLLARWTCGFQYAIPVASKRFGVAMLLARAGRRLPRLSLGLRTWNGLSTREKKRCQQPPLGA